VLTVREGIVEAENFKESQKSLIRDGHSYLVNREGESKTEYDLDTIDLFNWDSVKVDEPLPTLDAVVEKLGDLGPTLDDQEKARIQLWKEVDEKINGFRKTDEELNRELEILTENADLSRKGLTEERKKIEQDIRCIKTSVTECLLSSEKILLQEGFPRLWGTPQYRNSMVVGLQKYLQGREEEVKSREEEALEIKKLMQRRAAALRAMEVDRKNETNPEKIMLLLQDARLRR
jgi:predicted ribosome quality control (RQC) complex YloA/Tae2 family protein